MKFYQDMLDVLDQYGLLLTAENGGVFNPNIRGVVDVTPYTKKTTISFHNGDTIPMIDSAQFLRLLRETEDSFNIKLFVNV